MDIELLFVFKEFSKLLAGNLSSSSKKIKSFVWDIRQCALRFQQAYQEWNLRNAMPAGSEI